MSKFHAGDKVIKRSEKDASNYGEVMNIRPMFAKPGYIAVYFRRQVWIKSENLMHIDEWKKKQGMVAPQGSVRDYWTK